MDPDEDTLFIPYDLNSRRAGDERAALLRHDDDDDDINLPLGGKTSPDRSNP
jgi:hypothetical protein